MGKNRKGLLLSFLLLLFFSGLMFWVGKDYRIYQEGKISEKFQEKEYLQVYEQGELDGSNLVCKTGFEVRNPLICEDLTLSTNESESGGSRNEDGVLLVGKGDELKISYNKSDSTKLVDFRLRRWNEQLQNWGEWSNQAILTEIGSSASYVIPEQMEPGKYEIAANVYDRQNSPCNKMCGVYQDGTIYKEPFYDGLCPTEKEYGVNEGYQDREECTNTCREEFEVKECVPDICANFIIDSSGSIGEEMYWIMKQRVEKLVSEQIFRFGEKGSNTRFGITLFSNEGDKISELTDNKESFIDKLRNMDYVGGGTCTSCGIDMAISNFNESPQCQNLDKINILITDGVYNTGYDPSIAARKIREFSKLYGVCVGGRHGCGMEYYTDLTYSINNYNELSNAFVGILSDICPGGNIDQKEPEKRCADGDLIEFTDSSEFLRYDLKMDYKWSDVSSDGRNHYIEFEPNVTGYIEELKINIRPETGSNNSGLTCKITDPNKVGTFPDFMNLFSIPYFENKGENRDKYVWKNLDAISIDPESSKIEAGKTYRLYCRFIPPSPTYWKKEFYLSICPEDKLSRSGAVSSGDRANYNASKNQKEEKETIYRDLTEEKSEKMEMEIKEENLFEKVIGFLTNAIEFVKDLFKE